MTTPQGQEVVLKESLGFHPGEIFLDQILVKDDLAKLSLEFLKYNIK